MANDDLKNKILQEQLLGESTIPTIPKSYYELLQLFEPKTPTKKAWPSLVGLTAEEAEEKIKKEALGVYVVVVPPSHAITFDLRPDRVWLFVDSSGTVVQTPAIG